VFIKLWLDVQHSAFYHCFALWLIETDVFQLPQLHKHFNVVCHTMPPQLPLIAISADFLELVDKDYPLNQATAYGLIKGANNVTQYFDKEGNVWRSEIIPKNFRSTFLTRLLAKTFYNPKLDVDRIWTRTRDYNLKELKECICFCIDKDDDILTQFVEADTLKARLRGCNNFKEIVEVLSKYVYNPDEEKIYEEFPSAD
jgi:hypothetical protein